MSIDHETNLTSNSHTARVSRKSKISPRYRLTVAIAKPQSKSRFLSRSETDQIRDWSLSTRFDPADRAGLLPALECLDPSL